MISAICFLLLRGPGNLRKEIQSRYNDFNLGMKNKDPKMLAGLMTADFSGDTPEGKKITRDQAVQQFVGLATVAKDAKWSRKVVKTTLHGAEVVATVEGQFSGKMPARDGKLHAMDLVSQVEDTWVKSSGKWQVRRSHMLKVSIKMDGKAVPMGRS